AGLAPDLRVADAERLPFSGSTFDVVYSYGVMHHSPGTPQCVKEARRVLKTGGEARIMVYHPPSWAGMMLWVRDGVFRGQSLRRSVYERLESPGTKTYTQNEALELMTGYEDVTVRTVFSPGDLLLNRPSARFEGSLYKAIWKLYPRWLVRALGPRWGLFL